MDAKLATGGLPAAGKGGGGFVHSGVERHDVVDCGQSQRFVDYSRRAR
jgi:hypothetical protein